MQYSGRSIAVQSERVPDIEVQKIWYPEKRSSIESISHILVLVYML